MQERFSVNIYFSTLSIYPRQENYVPGSGRIVPVRRPSMFVRPWDLRHIFGIGIDLEYLNPTHVILAHNSGHKDSCLESL